MDRSTDWVIRQLGINGFVMSVNLRELGQHPGDLDRLFRQYHRELNRFAYGKLRDREAASDIVQDAFARLLAHQRAGAVVESPRFFLWRIATNLLIDAVRRDRRHGPILSLESVSEQLIDSSPSAERGLVARQEFRIIKNALDELAPKARAALLLNRVEGLSHSEIAARLKISPSMVSKHILTALRHCIWELETRSR
jgi:RNA polymerase sigma factor (sigma-70 family)